MPQLKNEQSTSQESQEWVLSLLNEGRNATVTEAVESLANQKEQEKIADAIEEGLMISTSKAENHLDPVSARRIKLHGEVFERVAIKVLEKEIGEPDNPELSKFLVDVMRHPRKFLDDLSEKMQSALRKSDELGLTLEEVQKVNRRLEQIREDSHSLPKHPRTSDAVAYKNSGNTDSIAGSVEITGSYEMKGHKSFANEDKLMGIGYQLKESKDDIYKIFRTFSKYYPTYKALCATPEETQYLPKEIKIVDEADFETILVVPENANGVGSDKDLEQTLSKLSKYGCSDIKKIGISTKEVAAIAEDLSPKIYAIERARRSRKS
jgi:hypothetical protein